MDVVISSWVLCCWKVLFLVVIPSQMQLFFFPLLAFLQNVDVFGHCLATFFSWNLHSFWFSPVSSASSRPSVAIIHPGFTCFHGHNAPGEGNPFIPVRNQSFHTLVSSFSPPVPCRLRKLRKPGMTRYRSKCAGGVKNSTITPNFPKQNHGHDAQQSHFPTSLSIIQ